MNNFSKKIYSFLSSKKLTIGIIIFFIFESTWIAVSAAYPQAFDEDYHFGLIKIYSHNLLPFFTGQPNGGNQFGAIARDPSYLYQYLMSFPYRIIEHLTTSQLAQVIILRFINIALVVLALSLFYKVIRRTGASKILTNIVLLLFILIPIVPQLSAQINYDNMLLPIIAWNILLSFELIKQIKNKSLKFRTLIGFFIVGLTGSLVKYVYLPIFLASIVFIIIYLYINNRHKFKTLLNKFISDFKKESRAVKTILLIIFFILLGMFMQRDGVNLIKYHDVEPSCAQVLTTKQCSAYGPWEYNNESHKYLENQKHNGHNPIQGPFYYTKQWLYWMWFRLFFAVNGPETSFKNYPPLPLPSAGALVIFFFGIILFIKYRKQVFKENVLLSFLFSISIFYLLVLYLQGYSSYRYTNVLENMNGRYLLPVLLPIAIVFAEVYSIALKKHFNLKIILAVIVLLLFIEGGGIFTFISRSDDTWDVSNKVIRQINDDARHVTSPVIIKGNKHYWTNTWFFN